MSVTEAERARLQRMLALRDGMPGFTENVKAIKRRLAELEAELSKKDD